MNPGLSQPGFMVLSVLHAQRHPVEVSHLGWAVSPVSRCIHEERRGVTCPGLVAGKVQGGAGARLGGEAGKA